MPCLPIPGGFACSRGTRTVCAVPSCGRTATYLCDYQLTAGARATCDSKLCDRHARIQAGKRGAGGELVHFCPAHDEAARNAAAAR